LDLLVLKLLVLLVLLVLLLLVLLALLALLQGRLPVRVELVGLTADDFFRILTEPEHNMIRQQQVLLATEGVDLTFTEGGIRAIAKAAEQANKLLDNIGARRLHTVMERVLADISFSAPDKVAAARRHQQEAAAAGSGSQAEGSGQVMQFNVAGDSSILRKQQAASAISTASIHSMKSRQASSLDHGYNHGSSAGQQTRELLVKYEVTERMVEDCMKEILKHQDLSRYVL
jgi:hypothetical protein